MSFRFMRVFAMFDMPTLTTSDRREYRKFRKFLIKLGFIMLQESVYVKLVLNSTAAKTVQENVKRNAPPKGLVQLINVTERQFASMEFVTGSFESEYVVSSDRLVIL